MKENLKKHIYKLIFFRNGKKRTLLTHITTYKEAKSHLQPGDKLYKVIVYDTVTFRRTSQRLYI